MTEHDNLNHGESSEEQLHIGLQILSFCIPLAGAIIYFMKKDNEPKQAKRACTAALLGIGLGIILQIIAYMVGAGANAF